MYFFTALKLTLLCKRSVPRLISVYLSMKIRARLSAWVGESQFFSYDVGACLPQRISLHISTVLYSRISVRNNLERCVIKNSLDFARLGSGHIL